MFEAKYEMSTASTIFQEGEVTWRSPANIALIKYWGKRDNQIPMNPSISFTLSNCYTETTVAYTYNQESEHPDLIFYFEGQRNDKFGEKLTVFIDKMISEEPLLKGLSLTIHSRNTFPHSAGIASSASGMSAFCLCLVDIVFQLKSEATDTTDFYRKASEWSRLASGSASRSVYGGLVTWGRIDGMSETSDYFATQLQKDVHPVFNGFRDTVIICDFGEKSVSSRAGHGLMNTNPFAEARYQQARENMQEILKAIESGDLESFGRIIEAEALTLHALMMSSEPSFILLKPKTLEVIEKIRTHRAATKIPMYFTIDAGPNIHLLYPEAAENAVHKFLDEEIYVCLGSSNWIEDRTGVGPIKISSK
jgi:diphosphomevalonate decarboxylase